MSKLACAISVALFLFAVCIVWRCTRRNEDAPSLTSEQFEDNSIL